MSQKEVDALFQSRDVALLINDLERVFGKGNVFIRTLQGGGQISLWMLARALLRNQMHLTERISRIEARIGMQWDAKSLDKKPEPST
jgi:hypothetical protein